MKYGLALVVALLMGCTPETKDADRSEFDKKFQEYLDADNFVMAALTVEDETKVRGFDKVAPDITKSILTKWAKAEETELATSTTLGRDRALGRPKDYCGRCRAYRELLDKLAPKSPEIATRWTELKSKLDQAETAAFDKESNDKRPIVLIWQQGTHTETITLELISICLKETLTQSVPQYKWLAADRAPDAGAAQFLLTGKTATDKYVDSRTNKEAATLLSGLRVVVTPRNFDASLSARFPEPFEASSVVDSPDTIRSDLPVGGPPIVETVKVGGDQLMRIKNTVCANLAKHIENTAMVDAPKPAASAGKK